MTHYSRFETEPGRQEYRLVDLDDPANSAIVTVYGDDVVADSIVDHLNATAPAVVSPIETLVNRILDVLEQQGVALTLTLSSARASARARRPSAAGVTSCGRRPRPATRKPRHRPAAWPP